MTAFRDLLATPFGWAMGLIYNWSHNYLLALVLITLVLRVVLVPLAVTQQKNSAKQMRLQAKVNKIRAKYAGVQSREAQMKISEETQELYRREGFNASTAGCLPMALQLLVMMGLYGAMYAPLTKVLLIGQTAMDALKAAMETVGAALTTGREELDILNKFPQLVPVLRENGSISEELIARIEAFVENFRLFGIDLTSTPKDSIKELGMNMIVLIPILAGLSSILTAIYSYIKQRKTNPEMAKNPMMGCMTLFSPALSIYFSVILPSGVGVYWILSNILAFVQLIALDIFIKPADLIAGQMIDETVERRSREESVKKRIAFAEKNAAEK